MLNKNALNQCVKSKNNIKKLHNIYYTDHIFSLIFFS